MVDRQDGSSSPTDQDVRRRRVGVAAFVVGAGLVLGFFAFFPGLPHVIDWGAILVSLVGGGIARWACRAWMAQGDKR
nr:hypothetical protein [Streptomyces caniscabiei]